jgi:stringent starvation protein B
MSQLTSTKPYLLRAIHEWCVDNNLTPHLLVAVNNRTIVPMAYVKEGEIVLNLNYGATKDLLIENGQVTFSARFGGVPHHLYIPMGAVKGIFSRENGQGMFFEVEEDNVDTSTLEASESSSATQKNANEIENKSTNYKKPSLKIVK